MIKEKSFYYNYDIEEKYEAGLVLLGSEVKSLREGRASLKGAYVKKTLTGFYIVGLHIPLYKWAQSSIDPLRERALLLKKKEIRLLSREIEYKGYNLLPLEIYTKRGYFKVLVGLGRGKKKGDKRETIKKRDMQRQIERDLKQG